MIRHLLLSFLILTSVHAEGPLPKLHLLDGAACTTVPMVMERFQTPSVTVPMTFLVKEGETVRPVLDLYLDADTLGVPLQRDVPFEGKIHPTYPSLLEGAFHISLRPGDRPVMYRIMIRTAARENQTSEILGSVRLRMLPRDQLKTALTRCTDSAHQGKGPSLVVFGKAEGLRELLKDWHIPFEDLGDDPPAVLEANTITIGTLDDLRKLPRGHPTAALLVLTADSTLDLESKELRTDQARLTILRRHPGDNWRDTPRFHRLLLKQLEPYFQSHE